MASETKRAKTETLSLRLDPKSRFMLEFLSRIKGQSITAVVEHAIREAANQTCIGTRKNWSLYWDASEGVRTLNLIKDPDYPTTYEEDEIRRFTLVHWMFFYMEKEGDHTRRAYVDILWPKINYFKAIWDDTRSTNYWAAGEAMIDTLRTARVAPPTNWPPAPKNRPLAPKNSPKRPDFADDLDDDIPF